MKSCQGVVRIKLHLLMNEQDVLKIYLPYRFPIEDVTKDHR